MHQPYSTNSNEQLIQQQQQEVQRNSGIASGSTEQQYGEILNVENQSTMKSFDLVLQQHYLAQLHENTDQDRNVNLGVISNTQSNTFLNGNTDCANMDASQTFIQNRPLHTSPDYLHKQNASGHQQIAYMIDENSSSANVFDPQTNIHCSIFNPMQYQQITDQQHYPFHQIQHSQQPVHLNHFQLQQESTFQIQSQQSQSIIFQQQQLIQHQQLQQQQQEHQQQLIQQQQQLQQLNQQQLQRSINLSQDPNFNSIFILQNRFDVPKRYELLIPIGIGGYGVVAKALDKQKQDHVAIKKIFKPFLNPLETKRILREIKILKALKHDNVISIRDVLLPVPKDRLEDIYIVSQLMDTDLHQIISSDQPISEDHIQYFMYQLLCGLKYIHSAGVFHRDLKPGNLLVNSDCELKICDFGLARTVDSKVNVLVMMTEYVATRWYRAPELLLSWNKYTTAIDMWAVGCIFSELFLRKPLLPGESYLNQLILTLNLTGTPQKEDLENILSDRAKQFITSLGNKAPKDLSKLISNASPCAIDLIQKMLVFNPEKRIRADEALKHPFFESIRDPDYEVEAKGGFKFDFEREDVQVSELKDAIFHEMAHFHPHFDQNNPNSYAYPITHDADLFTLDYDGSKIFIDYRMGAAGGRERGEQSQQIVQNIQSIQEQMVKDIIGVDGNGQMIDNQTRIKIDYTNDVIFSPSQIEQSAFHKGNNSLLNYQNNQKLQSNWQQLLPQSEDQSAYNSLSQEIQYQQSTLPLQQQQQLQQQYLQQVALQPQQYLEKMPNSVFMQNVQVFELPDADNRILEE